MAKNSLIWFSSDCGPCLRAKNILVVSIPDKCPFEKLLDPCVAEYSVTEPTRRETCGSMCTLLLIGRVEQMANGYIEGKTDEYSSKLAWSSVGEQYPEGLTRGVIQVHEQWSRQGQTESKRKAKG